MLNTPLSPESVVMEYLAHNRDGESGPIPQDLDPLPLIYGEGRTRPYTMDIMVRLSVSKLFQGYSFPDTSDGLVDARKLFSSFSQLYITHEKRVF